MASIRKMLFALLAASTLWISMPASAQYLELWDGTGWVKSGSVSYTGYVKLTYIGIMVPCYSGWTLSLTAGVGNFQGMTQSGSTTCLGVIASNLPWTTYTGTYNGPNPPFTGSPTLTAPLHSITITGVRIYIPAPVNVNCPSSTTSGTIKGWMDSGGGIVFKSTLGPCTFETLPNQRLIPSVPVRVVW